MISPWLYSSMESMYLAHRSFFQRNLLAHQTMEYHFRKFSMHTGHTGGEGGVTNDFQQNLKESGEDERGGLVVKDDSAFRHLLAFCFGFGLIIIWSSITVILCVLKYTVAPERKSAARTTQRSKKSKLSFNNVISRWTLAQIGLCIGRWATCHNSQT